MDVKEREEENRKIEIVRKKKKNKKNLHMGGDKILWQLYLSR